MSVGMPFNGAIARVRELITRLRYEADQSAIDEAARLRARELDAEEYATRHPTRLESSKQAQTRSDDAP